jgi:hypothetical protein
MAEEDNKGAAYRVNQDNTIYKVTVVNSQGTPIIAYVNADRRHAYVRAMNEEYGNAKIEAVDPSDLPKGANVQQ